MSDPVSEVAHEILTIGMHTQTPYDVFVNYSGHINALSATIHKGAKYDDEDDPAAYSRTVNLGKESSLTELNGMKQEILDTISA